MRLDEIDTMKLARLQRAPVRKVIPAIRQFSWPLRLSGSHLQVKLFANLPSTPAAIGQTNFAKYSLLVSVADPVPMLRRHLGFRTVLGPWPYDDRIYGWYFADVVTRDFGFSVPGQGALLCAFIVSTLSLLLIAVLTIYDDQPTVVTERTGHGDLRCAFRRGMASEIENARRSRQGGLEWICACPCLPPGLTQNLPKPI
jgi:hypothetical protein